MYLSKIGGKSFLVNLLSDFIVDKMDITENSIIKVIDCENFLVVKGKTSSKNVLDLSSVVSEFTKKYEKVLSGRIITHTIDLITYDYKLEPTKQITHRYYNSESNCSYDFEGIEHLEKDYENNFVHVSSFPHGYSLPQGRLLFYYGKKIIYNIPPTLPFKSLILTISTEKDNNNEQIFKVYDEFHKSYDEVLRSAALDVFDFDFMKFQKDVEKFDWSIELLDPLIEHEFLKEKVRDFIVI